MKTLIAWLLLAGTASAQVREVDLQLPSETARIAADLASWGTVLTTVGFDTYASFGCDDRSRCLVKQALRTGAVFGAAYLAKALVRRERPCAPDCGRVNPNHSFFSAHTALAFSTLDFKGPRLTVMLPLAISTGGLRVAGGKHWLSDAVVGAAVGSALSYWR